MTETARLSLSRPVRALQWAVNTFGKIALDPKERAARLVEETLELAQTQGLTAETVNAIAARVYASEPGLAQKEVGQVAMTLECLAENIGLNTDTEARREFLRVTTIPREVWQRRHSDKAKIGIASPCGDIATL